MDRDEPTLAGRRLLYVVSEDWYFLSHRLPMARAARDAGCEVHVATHVQNGAAKIETEGFVLHPIPFQRGRISASGALQTIAALRAIHRKVNPHIVHHISLQPAVFGAIATLGRQVASIHALTGLGFVFTSSNVKARLLRPFIASLLRFFFNRKATVVLVQNADDQRAVTQIGISPDHIAIIPGSGVDTDRLVPTPEPAGEVTIGFAGRLLDDKGIRPLVEAIRMLRGRGNIVRLLIAGTPDPANPSSVPEREIASWQPDAGLVMLGHVEDIATLWRDSAIAVLPSRREGLPKSLLEAAACGRPMVATDVPGCREVVIPNETGLIVPVDDPVALATAIETLAQSPALRKRFGDSARILAVEKFDSKLIGPQTVTLYRRALAGLPDFN